MPKVCFLPQKIDVESKEGAKLLAIAIKNKLPIQYSCASCKCGTCAIKIIEGQLSVTKMEEDEKNLLDQLGLDGAGQIRLACRTKVGSTDVVVDLDFQKNYE